VEITTVVAYAAFGVSVVAALKAIGCIFCNDGWLSRSYGKQGAGSRHGGWRSR
jgi:hypothetical protein